MPDSLSTDSTASQNGVPVLPLESETSVVAVTTDDVESLPVWVMRHTRSLFGVGPKEHTEPILSDVDALEKAIKDGDYKTAQGLLEKHRNMELPGSPVVEHAMRGGRSFKFFFAEVKNMGWGFVVECFLRSCYFFVIPGEPIVKLLLHFFVRDQRWLLPYSFLPYTVYPVSCVLNLFLSGDMGSTAAGAYKGGLEAVKDTASIVSQLSCQLCLTGGASSSIRWLWLAWVGDFLLCMGSIALVRLFRIYKPSIALQILDSKKLSEEAREALLRQVVVVMSKHEIPFDKKGTLVKIPKQGYDQLFTLDFFREVSKDYDRVYDGGSWNAWSYHSSSMYQLLLYKVSCYTYKILGEGTRTVNVMHLAYEQQDKNRSKEILAHYADKCFGVQGTTVVYHPLPTIKGDIRSGHVREQAFENLLTMDVGTTLLKYWFGGVKSSSTDTPSQLGNPFRPRF